MPTCCDVCKGKAIPMAKLACPEDPSGSGPPVAPVMPQCGEPRSVHSGPSRGRRHTHLQVPSSDRNVQQQVHSRHDISPNPPIRPRYESPSEGTGRRKSWNPSKQALRSPKNPRKLHEGPQKKIAKSKRAQWSTEALHLAIEGLDQGWKMSEVCEKYKIPRSSLRDHVVGRSRGRKMGPKTILTKDEEEKLCEYINVMVDWGHPMTPNQLKSKVAEITQNRVTPFKNGIPGESWLKWFRRRHPNLVLRVPQGLDHKRARSLNVESVTKFYETLEWLYLQHHYAPDCI